MEYVSEEDGYPEPQQLHLEMWGVPVLHRVEEEREREEEDEEEEEENVDEDFSGMAVLSQYDDHFVVDEALLSTTVPDPIRLKGIGGITV